MKQTKLEQMLDVTEVVYLREFEKVKDILAEETAVRQKLAQLDAQVSKNRFLGAEDHSMKTVGADILWQGWVTRTRRELNTELARIMAQKLNAMDGVRKAFGRQKAVENLVTVDVESKKRALETRLQAAFLTRW